MTKITVQKFVDRIEWKIALKTALAASLSLFLSFIVNSYLKRPDYIISGMWAALAAIVVQQTHLGSTYKSAWARFLGVLIGCTMGGLFTTLFGSHALSLGISIFLTIVICSLFNIKDSLRIACMSVAVVMLLWGLKPYVSPWVFGFYRFWDSCLGISVAVIIAHLVWPLHVSKKLTQQVVDIILNIRIAYTTASSISSEQSEDVRKLLRKSNETIWKSRQMLEDSKLELLTAYADLDEWKFLFNHLSIAVDRVRVLNMCHKQNLPHLLKGDPLVQQLQEHSNATIDYLEKLEKALINTKALPQESEIYRTLTELNAGLATFRKSKKTRPLNLEDVEGFFVFFFTIRSFSEEIFKVRGHLNKISEEI